MEILHPGRVVVVVVDVVVVVAVDVIAVSFVVVPNGNTAFEIREPSVKVIQTMTRVAPATGFNFLKSNFVVEATPAPASEDK